ncbi:hypothetical protein PTKIN_Ptkin01aG0294600 [Pterospermum kingtungense]
MGSTVKKIRPKTAWSKPMFEEVKFNVDGVSTGKPGPAGIRGVLRDHRGLELIKFSRFIDVLSKDGLKGVDFVIVMSDEC